MRPARTPKELKGIAGEVVYEINRMREAAAALEYLGSRPRSDARQFFVNYFLEGFLLHLRNLRDFFHADEPRKDDVIAEDFFSGPKRWHSVRPPLAPVIRDSKKRIDRALAHISYSRLDYTGAQKLWPVAEMLTQMESAIGSFIGDLRNDRSHWFEKAADSEQKHVEAWLSVVLDRIL